MQIHFLLKCNELIKGIVHSSVLITIALEEGGDYFAIINYFKTVCVTDRSKAVVLV